MKPLFWYIILFIFILFAFFKNEKERQTYTPVPEGILYCIDASSKTILQEQVTETTLYKSDTGSDLPTLYLYSELKLPPKFIARTTAKENAVYIVYNATQQVKMVYYKGKKQKAPKQPDSRTVEQKNPFTVKKEEKETVNNFYTLNNYAKNSDKTYFFSGKEQSLNDVNVRVYSLTPFQNKSILKFQMTNSQQQYFFVSNISIYNKKNNLIPCDFYNEPLLAPDKTIDCIVLLPSQQKQTQLILKLTESGNKNRAFSVSFTTP